MHTEVTIVWFLLFSKGLGWERTAAFDPSLSDIPDNSPINIVLQFFINGIILLAIGSI
jgi:hypothetical protein